MGHGRGGRLASGLVGCLVVWWVVVVGWAGLGLVVGPSVVLDIALGVHIFIALQEGLVEEAECGYGVGVGSCNRCC